MARAGACAAWDGPSPRRSWSPSLLALVVIQFVIQAFKIPSASMEDSLLIGDFLLGIKFVYGSPIPFPRKSCPASPIPSPGTCSSSSIRAIPHYPGGDRERYRFLANLFLFGNLYWDRETPEGGKHLVWYQPKDFIKRCVAQSGQTIHGLRHPSLHRRQGDAPAAQGQAQAALHPRLRTPAGLACTTGCPLPGETLDLDTLTLKRGRRGSAPWPTRRIPAARWSCSLDLMKDSVVDNAYVLPYLHGDPREPMHHGTVYALLKLALRHGLRGRHALLPRREHPFKLIQDAARTGFLSVNDLMYPRRLPGHLRPSRKRMRGASPAGQEFNEYFMGHYLDLIDRNVAGQGQQAGARYWIRARLSIDGVAGDTYTVKEKCYFMMGDNRDHSSDSRYWGLLSTNFVKAKAFIIYFSFDNEDGAVRLANPITWLRIPFKIRWTRIGKLID